MITPPPERGRGHIAITFSVCRCMFAILYSHYICPFKTKSILQIWTCTYKFNNCATFLLIKQSHVTPIPPATHFSYLFTYSDRFTFILTLFNLRWHLIRLFVQSCGILGICSRLKRHWRFCQALLFKKSLLCLNNWEWGWLLIISWDHRNVNYKWREDRI